MTEASASVGLLLATVLLNNNQNMLAKLTPIIAWLLWGLSLAYHNQQQKMKLIPTKQDNYKECDLHQSAVVFHGPNTFHTVSKLIKLCKVNYFCFLKPLQEILTICLAGINWLCERWLFSRCSFCLINLVLIIPA